MKFKILYMLSLRLSLKIIHEFVRIVPILTFSRLA